MSQVVEWYHRTGVFAQHLSPPIFDHYNMAGLKEADETYLVGPHYSRGFRTKIKNSKQYITNNRNIGNIGLSVSHHLMFQKYIKYWNNLKKNNVYIS